MKPCRGCQTPFEPVAFEVFCGPDCAAAANSGRREVQTDLGRVTAAVTEVQALAPPEFKNEAAFQDWFNGYARARGWSVYHTLDSRGSEFGFPDTVCLREKDGRVRQVVAELKMVGNKPTEAQKRWLALFEKAGAETYTWWPHDLPTIREVLS